MQHRCSNKPSPKRLREIRAPLKAGGEEALNGSVASGSRTALEGEHSAVGAVRRVMPQRPLRDTKSEMTLADLGANEAGREKSLGGEV